MMVGVLCSTTTTNDGMRNSRGWTMRCWCRRGRESWAGLNSEGLLMLWRDRDVAERAKVVVVDCFPDVFLHLVAGGGIGIGSLRSSSRRRRRMIHRYTLTGGMTLHHCRGDRDIIMVFVVTRGGVGASVRMRGSAHNDLWGSGNTILKRLPMSIAWS